MDAKHVTRYYRNGWEVKRKDKIDKKILFETFVNCHDAMIDFICTMPVKKLSQ